MRREIVYELPGTGSKLIPQIIPVFTQDIKNIKTTTTIAPSRSGEVVTSIDNWNRKVR